MLLNAHSKKRRLLPAPYSRLIVLFSLLFVQYSYGQTITLDVKNAGLEQVFRAIEGQVEQRFVYTREMLDKAEPVTVNLRRQTLAKVLSAVFENQPLVYQLDERFVTVRMRTSAVAMPQPPAVTGLVLEETGKPIAGATVMVKRTKMATATNLNGRFELPQVQENEVLVVSFVGYGMKEILAGKNVIVTLSVAVNELDRAIVIGYGVTTRRLSTGNVSKVSGDEIGKHPVSNPLATLQGRVPGMIITQSSGVPGSGFKVEIRGQSALDLSLSRNDPLFIIDGVPFEPGNLATNQLTSAANNPTSISQGGLSPLNSINPSDIESIEVLKDADATAIYGSRGANGVILITTKKAKGEATTVKANYYQGWSRAPAGMPLLTTKEYLTMRREGLRNEGLPVDAANAPDLVLWDTTRYTDFRKLLTGNTATVHSAQLSLEGGTGGTRFLLSANYRRETNVFSKDFNNQIAGGRLQVNHTSPNQRLSVQVSTAYSADVNALSQMDLTRFITLPPNLKLKDSTGKLAWQEGGVAYSSISNELVNPLAELRKRYRSENNNFLVNLLLSYRLNREVSLKVSGGVNRFSSDEYSISPSTSIDPFLNLLPFSSFANSYQKSWIAEPQVQWDKTKNRHHLSLLVGSTFQQKRFYSEALSGTNYASDELLYSIRGAGQITATNNESDYRYTALFARFHYDWDRRYLLNVTGRRDGSSRFAPENRFASFGSIGAGWVFSSEKWFKAKWVSFGKLRASYGVTGNDQIGDYRFLNLWSNTSVGYGGVPGLMPRTLYNPTYEWEKNKKAEVALEAGFFKDRIQFSSAYYRNRSSNQLVNYSLPSQTGFFSVVQNLPALVENSGLEFVLSSTVVKTKDWNWSASLNITFPKNRLVSFPGLASSPYFRQYTVGKSLSNSRGFKFLGVDSAGLYTFDDGNKDGLWNDADYIQLPNLDPKAFGGFSNSVSYKGFGLSFLFEFRKQTGRNYLNQMAYYIPGTIYNQPNLVLDRWQKPGDNAMTQRFSGRRSGLVNTRLQYLRLSDGIFSDASFIRLRNVHLDYSFPSKFLQRLHLKNARIYGEAQNLFVITNYQGSDPETQNFYVLPPLRSVVVGLQLTL